MEEQFKTSGESQPALLSNFDLSVGSIIANAFSLGFKYFFQIIISFILWLITLWIPYINVGTTIGLYGLVVKIAKGENFSIGEIFRKEYRQKMPEFLLLTAIFGITIPFAYMFFIVPGIILSIAWAFSFYFLIDKNLNAIEALKVSNQTTFGHKWDIFGGMFILYLIGLVLTLIIWLIFKTPPEDTGFESGFPGLGIPSFPGILIIIIVWIIISCLIYGAEAYIYKELSKKVETIH